MQHYDHNMTNLEDTIGNIVRDADDKTGEDPDGRKVVQRITLTPEQKKVLDDAVACAKKGAEMFSKAETLKNKFWADLELASGFFLNQMRYDEKQDVVFVYESPIK